MQEEPTVDPEHRKSSSTRKWWLLIGGGVLLYIVVFNSIESFVRPEPSEDGSTPGGADASTAPALPEVRMRDSGEVEIRHDFFRRSGYRTGSEATDRALFDCLTQGIEEAFGDGTEGWDRQGVRAETQRIQDECMGLPDIPAPLPPLPPGDADG